jgi:hypothetical protein
MLVVFLGVIVIIDTARMVEHRRTEVRISLVIFKRILSPPPLWMMVGLRVC